MIAFVLIASLLIIKPSRLNGQACMGVACKNNGTVEEMGCRCKCSENFSGIYCEYEIETSNWPEGPYAIPTPIDGCPESYPAGWTNGYVNITTRVPMEIWITQNIFKSTSDDPGNNRNDSTMFNIAEDRLHIPYTLGPYGRYTFQMNFCYKTNAHPHNAMTKWPSGDYAVYGTHDGCPQRFDGHNFTIAIPEVTSVSRDGDLPYMDIRFELTQVQITLLICQRSAGNGQKNPFLSETPFVFLKGKGDCSVFGGFSVRSESLHAALLGQTDTQTVDELSLQMCYYTPQSYIEKTVVDQTIIVQQGSILPTCHTFVNARSYVQEGYDTWYSKYRKYFTSGYLDHVDVYSEVASMARGYVPLFQYSDHVPWVLFDLKQTSPIHSIVIRLALNILGDYYADINLHNYPDVFVSEDKWSFLNHGAIIARSVTYQSVPFERWHVFLKQQEGRYVSIVATQYKTDALEMEFFLKMQQFNILTNCAGENKDLQLFCQRELGMSDNLIQDFQLIASSYQPAHPPGMARQYLAGWCAIWWDVNPYLQVDLISPTTINGITVINDYREEVEYDQDRQFIRKTIPIGCKSFQIAYGTNLESLTYYQTVFELDLSMPYTQPQTKLFRKPFLARYVRIYPQAIQDANPVCLRLELLGCAKTVISSDQCDTNSIIYPTFSPNALVSPDNTMVQVSEMDTWAECYTGCTQDARNCRNMQYKGRACTVMAPSNTSLYVQTQTDNVFEIYTTLTCISDARYFKPSVKPVVSASNVGDMHLDNYYPSSEPRIITSLGYPRHYYTDQLYVWGINSINMDGTSNGYIKLLFSNISLHEYKGVTDESSSSCMDTIDIRYIENFHGGEPIYMMDYRSNDATPIVATDRSTVFVVLRTCHRNLEKTKNGIGFRAIIKSELVPNCLHIGQEVNCFMQKMTFGSHSFFGTIQTSNLYTWIINIRDTTTIILKIIDFDVNCLQGASFKILGVKSLTIDQSYCNKNRPYGPIKSVYDRLRIQYRPPLGDYQFYDGFYAEYSLRQIDPVLFEIASNSTDEPIYFDGMDSFDVGTVCSDVFMKCYYLVRSYNNKDYSWEEAADYCWSTDKMHLVSFHSELEFQYLRQSLVNFTKNEILKSNITLFNPSFSFLMLSTIDPLLYAHIGLRRYTDVNGKEEELWEDGTPLTFTAWGANQPADVHNRHCTRMGFHLLNEAHTWETAECDTSSSTPGAAGYFICQKPQSNSNVNMNLGINERVSAPSAGSPLFECEEHRYISPLSVCDGIPDCPHWLDETNCAVEDGQGVDMFSCDAGRHIQMDLLCNYVQDCHDGSDEYCEYPMCQSSEFKCDNMQCVPSFRRCDAGLDCLDGSDEMSCDTCNTTVAFQCADLSCVPVSLVCDGHVDCVGATDEQECNKTMTSCSAYWKAGYRENGTYNLDGGTVECQFFPSDNGTILARTLVHGVYIDYSFTNGESHPIVFDSPFLLNRINVQEACELKVFKICEPDLLALADHDGIYVGVLYSTCLCKMWSISYHPVANRMYEYQDCSNQTENRTEIMYTDNLPRTERKVRYVLTPVVCDVELNDVSKSIPCEDSRQMIPESKRCLYSTDNMGRIDGCRSLSHLQNCETFECPDNYAKCPNSFCIATKHVCDGVPNCPGGQDEENCYCKERHTKETVIMFFNTEEAETIRKAIYTLAKQLYTASEIVRVMQFTTTNFTTNKLEASNVLLVTDETVHSTHDQLRNQFVYYEVRLEDLVNRTIESFTDTFATNSIIIVQDSMSLIELSEFVDRHAWYTRSYFVETDENINKKAEITIESRITNIKIRKFGNSLVIDPFLFKELCKEPDVSAVCSTGYVYKCASSHVCIHLSQVCDDARDCPYRDDEYNCQFTCPNKCTCSGMVVDCRNTQFQSAELRTISNECRSLDLSHNNDLDRIYFYTEMAYLYRLNLSISGLEYVYRSTFSTVHNLQILDISYTKLKTIPTNTFIDLKALNTLLLSGNNLLVRLEPGAFNGLTNIRELTITGTRLNIVENGTFAGLKLLKLDLSSNPISTIEGMAFSDLEVMTIDLSSNDITNFDKDMFTGVQSLEFIDSDAYKVCCIRPSTVHEADCHPFKDTFSSCSDLVRSSFLRCVLWVIGICALLGNGLSLAYIFVYNRKRLKFGYGIFVTNLSVADFMMGVYLLIIAVADNMYRGKYMLNEDLWVNSIWCNIAGVLSTVAYEASVLFICLIALDRVFVIKFPIGRFRFNTKPAILFSILSWVLVIAIAMIPLLQADNFQNPFYKKSGICIALHLTRDHSAAWQFSVAIFIGFNFATFLLIAISQLFIYIEINCSSKMQVDSLPKARRNDLKIAKNILLVVATDFLCWFPIGCMGMMALNGHVISDDVYAWTAVLLLPINSVINPYLHTLSPILTKWNCVPRLEEVDGIGDSKSSDSNYGKSFMAIWESRFIYQPEPSSTVHSMSLNEYVDNTPLTPRDVLKIAVHLICGIRNLHECNLVLGKLDINSVLAVTLGNTQVELDYIQVQLKPSVCTNDTEKMEDMFCLGSIFTELIDASSTEDE